MTWNLSNQMPEPPQRDESWYRYFSWLYTEDDQGRQEWSHPTCWISEHLDIAWFDSLVMYNLLLNLNESCMGSRVLGVSRISVKPLEDCPTFFKLAIEDQPSGRLWNVEAGDDKKQWRNWTRTQRYSPLKYSSQHRPPDKERQSIF